MNCPDCNAEIKSHDIKQCPKCSALLLEISENGLNMDSAGGRTQNAGAQDNSSATPADEFDALLADIAADIDQILAAEGEDTAESEVQVQENKKPVAEPDRVLELTDAVELEDQKVKAPEVEDQPIEDLDALIQEFDELIESEHDFEPDTPDTFETNLPQQDERASEEPEAVIELTDLVQFEDAAAGPVEEVTEIELAPDLAVDPEPAEDESIEDLAADDFVTADDIEETTPDDFAAVEALDLQVSHDDEPIEEITAADFISVRALADRTGEKTYRDTRKKPKRSLKTLFIAAAVSVLLIAGVIGAGLYFKARTNLSITAPEPSAHAVQNEIKKEGVKVEQQLQATDHAKALPVDDTAKSRTDAANEDTLSQPQPAEESGAEPFGSENVDKKDTAESDAVPQKMYFTVQVATLKDQAEAEWDLNALRKKGYAGYLIEKKDSTGAVRYKLRFGKYKTKREAKQAAETFFDNHQTPYIIVQSNEPI